MRLDRERDGQRFAIGGERSAGVSAPRIRPMTMPMPASMSDWIR